MKNAKIIIAKDIGDTKRFENLEIAQVRSILKDEDKMVYVDKTIQVSPDSKINVTVCDTLYIINMYGYTIFIERERLPRRIMGIASDESLRAEIVRFLIELGISVTLKGFRYLIDAIVIALSDESALDNITNNIYKMIAITNNTTWRSVEKAIDRAIRTTSKRAESRVLLEVFGPDIDLNKFNPSPADFIITTTYKIKMYL